jgi:hypothetical protein
MQLARWHTVGWSLSWLYSDSKTHLKKKNPKTKNQSILQKRSFVIKFSWINSNSKAIRFNCKVRDCKTLRRNTGVSPPDLGLATVLQLWHQKHKWQKKKIDWTALKLQPLWCKQYHQWRQPTEWEKIFTDHVSDKGFVSRTHKELFKTPQLSKV